METESAEQMSRTALLKKIGVALAAASIGSLGTVAEASTRKSPPTDQLKLSRGMKLRMTEFDGRTYSVFFAHGGEHASAILFPANDGAGIQAARKQLGGSPALVKIEGGVIQISLGSAASGVSKNPGGVISFNPFSMSTAGSPIIRS